MGPAARHPRRPGGRLGFDGLADPAALDRIAQAIEEGRRAAVERPGREDGRHHRGRGVVGKEVEAHADPFAPRGLFLGKHLVDLRPVARPDRFTVGVMDGAARAPADLEKLARGGEERLARASDVAGEDGPGARERLREGHELGGVGVHARGIDQTGREAEGPCLERPDDDLLHEAEIGGAGARGAKAEGGGPHGPVGGEESHVHRKRALSEAIEVAFEPLPLPLRVFGGHPGEDGAKRGGARRRHRSRSEPAVPGDLRRDPLEELAALEAPARLPLENEDEVRVRVKVDEAGGDDEPVGIEDLGIVRGERGTRGLDPAVSKQKVGDDRLAAEPVVHGPAPDEPSAPVRIRRTRRSRRAARHDAPSAVGSLARSREEADDIVARCQRCREDTVESAGRCELIVAESSTSTAPIRTAPLDCPSWPRIRRHSVDRSQSPWEFKAGRQPTTIGH